VQPLRARKARALEMQLARVSASLRHGIKMVNSQASLMLSFRGSGKSPSETAGEIDHHARIIASGTSKINIFTKWTLI
jgi:hypothetical protein